MKCSNCGAEITGGKFCEFCGTQITTQMLKEQEQLNKATCQKCGSTNVSFYRENQGEVKGKRRKKVVHQTVGVCRDCGYTWTVNEKEKKRKTWLWVLGWLFFFPLPLTIILLKKKEMKPGIKYGIIAAAWVVFIILVFFGGGTNKKKESWPTGSIVDRLPKYSSFVDDVSSYSSFISISVRDVDQPDFEQYMSKCKEAGFDRDVKSGNTGFRGFDSDGYRLEMSYWSSIKKLYITISEPIAKDAKTISWPDNDFTKRIPKPDSLIGKIEENSSDCFCVYLTGISIDAYKLYVDECFERGFNVDYDMNDDSFSANDSEGYDLTIEYKGNDTVCIEMEKSSPEKKGENEDFDETDASEEKTSGIINQEEITTEEVTTKGNTTVEKKTEEKTTQSTTKQNITLGMKNALKSAKDYLAYSAFSYSGLMGQLEYEGYDEDEIKYALDNCGADWKEQAVRDAKDYLAFSAFSYSGLIEQLEYEGYTKEESRYGADNCGADWFEQAAKSAEDYLEFSSFSRSELYDQLKYEGFSSEQVEYALNAVGY